MSRLLAGCIAFALLLAPLSVEASRYDPARDSAADAARRSKAIQLSETLLEKLPRERELWAELAVEIAAMLLEESEYQHWLAGSATPEGPAVRDARDRALRYLDEIVTRWPNIDRIEEALFNRSFLLRRSLRDREALESYEMLVRRFPGGQYAPKAGSPSASSISRWHGAMRLG